MSINGKKIVLVNTLYSPYAVGGAEKSVELLAKKYASQGASVTLVTLNRGRENTTELIDGIRVVRIPLANLYWPFDSEKSIFSRLLWHVLDVLNFIMAFRFYKIVSRLRPDVIHTNNIQGFSVLIWMVARMLRVPVVHSIRDYYLLCPRTTMFKDGKKCGGDCIDCKLLSYPKKKLAGNVDVAVGVSSYIVDFHNEKGVFNNAERRYIYNKSDELGHTEIESIAVDEIKIIGFIGRLTKEKGIDEFLSMTKKINSLMNGGYSFVVAGNYESEKDFNLYKNTYVDVDFIGYCKADDFFKIIDLLIVPSKWDEPFGRVVVEAISNNIPVLVKRRGGLSEIVYDKYILDDGSCSAEQVLNVIELIKTEGYKIKPLKQDIDYPEVVSSVL